MARPPGWPSPGLAATICPAICQPRYTPLHPPKQTPHQNNTTPTTPDHMLNNSQGGAGTALAAPQSHWVHRPTVTKSFAGR